MRRATRVLIFSAAAALTFSPVQARAEGYISPWVAANAGTGFNGFGFLPGFDVTPATLAIGVSITLLLAVASGIVPALRAARLPIVQALRHVE